MSYDDTIPTTEQVDAMSPTELKVTENRLRRAAERQGLTLQKSRARDPHALDYGSYRLVDTNTNAIVAYQGEPFHYGLDLTDIATWLFDRDNYFTPKGDQ